MGSISGCGDLYRSQMSHRTVPHPRHGPTRAVSSGAHGNRLRNPDHAVEHLSGHGGFALLSRQNAGAQLRSDDRLVAPDRGLRETAPAVAGRLLPGHAALLSDDPNVAIALAPRPGVLRARHRRARGGMTMSGIGSGWWPAMA